MKADPRMLAFRQYVNLPRHMSGGFDHADVHEESGRVFVAHTATGSIEVIDGTKNIHLKTIRGCPEASGILCAQETGLVFAAARGAGKVMFVEPRELSISGQIPVGPRPNGLAWDTRRRQLVVADV